MADLGVSLFQTHSEIVRRCYRPAPAANFLPEILIHQPIARHLLDPSEREELDAFKSGPSLYAGQTFSGGDCLARWILDHPEEVRGKNVIDVASGSAVVAIACAMANAAKVTAVDIDPRAVTLIRHNATANNVSIEAVCANAATASYLFKGKQVITATDFYYDGAVNRRLLVNALLDEARRGKKLLLASHCISEVPMKLARKGESLDLSIEGQRSPPFFRKISYPVPAGAA